MSPVTNLDAIVVPELAGTPGTVSARLEAVRTRRPSRGLSEAGEERLRALVRATAPAGSGVRFREVESGNPGAVYGTVDVLLPDGRSAHARLIRPRAGAVCPADGDGASLPLPVSDAVPERIDGGGTPLVLAFPDAGRPVRGWHHLARFAALGYAVLALDAGVVDPDDVSGALPELALQALALAQAGLSLPGVDAARTGTLGEGLGGALAVLVAAALTGRVSRCVAQNPYPVDDPRLPDHVDAACVAPLMTCDFLMGTALLDELAPAEAQAALANGAGGFARQVFYPKFGHERINDFEDEVLRFLRFE